MVNRKALALTAGTPGNGAGVGRVSFATGDDCSGDDCTGDGCTGDGCSCDGCSGGGCASSRLDRTSAGKDSGRATAPSLFASTHTLCKTDSGDFAAGNVGAETVGAETSGASVSRGRSTSAAGWKPSSTKSKRPPLPVITLRAGPAIGAGASTSLDLAFFGSAEELPAGSPAVRGTPPALISRPATWGRTPRPSVAVPKLPVRPGEPSAGSTISRDDRVSPMPADSLPGRGSSPLFSADAAPISFGTTQATGKVGATKNDWERSRMFKSCAGSDGGCSGSGDSSEAEASSPSTTGATSADAGNSGNGRPEADASGAAATGLAAGNKAGRSTWPCAARTRASSTSAANTPASPLVEASDDPAAAAAGGTAPPAGVSSEKKEVVFITWWPSSARPPGAGSRKFSPHASSPPRPTWPARRGSLRYPRPSSGS